jgi:hypothetical protein
MVLALILHYHIQVIIGAQMFIMALALILHCHKQVLLGAQMEILLLAEESITVVVPQEGCHGDLDKKESIIRLLTHVEISLVIQLPSNLDKLSFFNIHNSHLYCIFRVHNLMSQEDNWSKEEEKATDCN